MQEDYVKTLENVIKQMLRPLRDLPLNLVINAISGFEILSFNPNDEQNSVLLRDLIKIAEIAGKNINKEGILRSRPNEVGNDIEAYVKDALNAIGYTADIPTTLKGNKKSTGYPDIEFVDQFDRVHYLECKTYNIKNIATTQRSFYLSPSEDFKITKNAYHFALSYEIYVEKKVETKNLYKCKSWKILSLENLLVDVKYEFNSDNRRLYSQNLILAKGIL